MDEVFAGKSQHGRTTSSPSWPIFYIVKGLN